MMITVVVRATTSFECRFGRGTRPLDCNDWTRHGRLLMGPPPCSNDEEISSTHARANEGFLQRHRPNDYRPARWHHAWMEWRLTDLVTDFASALKAVDKTCGPCKTYAPGI